VRFTTKAVFKFIPLATLVISLTGCAAYSVKLKESIDQGDYKDAFEDSKEWLEDNSGSEKNSEVDKVRRLNAIAHMELVRKINTPAAYKSFQAWARPRRYAADLQREAARLEGIAFYNQVTLKRPSISAFKAFRRQYPNSVKIADARLREATLALAKARRKNTIYAHQQFRREYDPWPEAEKTVSTSRSMETGLAFNQAKGANTLSAYKSYREAYKSWTESKPFISQARQLESKLAYRKMMDASDVATFKALRLDYEDWPELKEELPKIRTEEVKRVFDFAKGSNTLVAYREFRSEYETWPEAKTQLKDAYALETKRAFELAVLEKTLPPLDAFKDRYKDPRSQADINNKIADFVTTPVLELIAAKQLPSDQRIDIFLSRDIDRPLVKERFKSSERSLWKLVSRSKRALAMRLFHRLYPNSKNAARARKREPVLAWNAADQLNNWQSYEAFMTDYPNHPKALPAETRYVNLKRVIESAEQWPRVKVTYSYRLPGGDYMLYVDVRDCEGQLVSGLRKQVFETYFGHHSGQIVDFYGLEEDRPLDVVFGIDLSGSMATEREAVHQAVSEFAETLRFRGRNARFGLVAFSDNIAATHQPTGSPKRFRTWIRGLPKSAGGAHEDSIHAMFKGSTMNLRSNAERIFILITDEPLQVNTEGTRALKFPNCGKARRIKYPRLSRSCRRSRACIRRVNNQQRRKHKANARRTRGCRAGNVDEGSKVMNRITKKLTTKRMRLFMLVSDLSHHGFHSLENNVGGEIVPVPQDESDPGPYREALLHVSNKLSKQYLIRVRAPNSAIGSAFKPTVIARHMHLWRNIADLPAKQVLELFSTGGTPACPHLTLVSKDRGIDVTNDCSGQWSQVPVPNDVGTLEIAASHKRQLTLITNKGLLLYSKDRGKQSRVLELKDQFAVQTGFDVNGTLWAIGQSQDGNYHLWSGTEKMTLVRQAIPVKPGLFPVLLPNLLPTKESVCILTSANQMECRQKDGVWRNRKMKGIRPDVLRERADFRPLAGRTGGGLLSTSRGAVFRTIDGGRKWNRVLSADGRRRSIVFAPGKRSLLCMSGTKSIHCSEDTGRTFFQVGREFSQGAISGITAVNQQLFVAQNGGLQSLSRIVSRDIPASKVYFETGKSEPSARLRPFLDKLAQSLADDDDLRLRIEGHADMRGSASMNEKLAAERAEAVATYLTDRDVARDRLEVLSFGERMPVRRGSGAASLARNRRVELTVFRPAPDVGWGSNHCADAR